MRKALSNKNQPKRVSLAGALLVWLLLDRFQPPGWVWGVVLTFVGIVLLAQICDACTAKSIEIFTEEGDRPRSSDGAN
jgi:hypothetical protein